MDTWINFLLNLGWGAARAVLPNSEHLESMTMKVGMSTSDLDPTELVAIILGITIPFVALIVIVLLVLRHMRRISEMRTALIEKALETNQQLPAEFWQPKRRNSIWRNWSYSGLVWIAWGLGLAIFFYVADMKAIAALCCVPILIGLAKIVFAIQNPAEARGDIVVPPYSPVSRAPIVPPPFHGECEMETSADFIVDIDDAASNPTTEPLDDEQPDAQPRD